MAEVVMRQMAGAMPLPDGTMLSDHLEVSSAGTGGWHAGEPMDSRARLALERRGHHDHGHRAQAVDGRHLAQAEWVVCLDQGHRSALATRVVPSERLVLLRSFGPAADGGLDVPDPYYGDQRDFEACLDLIEDACRGLADEVAARVRHRPGARPIPHGEQNQAGGPQ
jgi:protein-tyrosine phosphatase